MIPKDADSVHSYFAAENDISSKLHLPQDRRSQRCYPRTPVQITSTPPLRRLKIETMQFMCVWVSYVMQNPSSSLPKEPPNQASERAHSKKKTDGENGTHHQQTRQLQPSRSFISNSSLGINTMSARNNRPTQRENDIKRRTSKPSPS